MANISQYIQQLMSAIYGEEVRGSLRDALLALSDDLLTHDNRIKVLENSSMGRPMAVNTSYDNTTSGLTSVDVQGAIDENASAVAALNSSAVTTYNTYYSSAYPTLSATAMRSGNVVTVYITSTSNYEMTKNTYIRIATLPEKYRPRWVINFAMYDNTATSASNTLISGRVGSNGEVDFWIYTGAPTQNAPRGCVSYCV